MNKKALIMAMNGMKNGEMPKEHAENNKRYAENRDDANKHSRESAPYMTAKVWHHESEPRGVMTAEMADEWAAGMVNTDGTTGAHWSKEQAKQIMAQYGIEADPKEFWLVLNSVYSDYCGVAKKHNVNKMEFYIDLAKAWLYDADSVDDKVWAYYDYIVKH